MSPSSLERRELEQDIDDVRSSIEAVEASRARLTDLVPTSTPSGGSSDSLIEDLTEFVEEFFEVAADTLGAGGDDEEEEGGDEDEVEGAVKVKPLKKTDAPKSVGAAFTKLRKRLAKDLSFTPGQTPVVPELQGVITELDNELTRLNADLRTKLDRLDALDSAIDDDTVPVHHTEHDPPVIVDPDADVTPPPPSDSTLDNDVVTNLVVDVDPDVVTPDTDVVPDPVVVDTDVVVVDTEVVTPVQDDTPAFEPGTQTEIGELDGAVYDVNEILASGKTVADLRKFDVPAGVVRDAGVSISAMIDGGYTLAELREAGSSAADLHGVASAADLRDAGFSAADMHGVFPASECIDAFSLHDLHDAGFSLSDFHGLVPLSSLRDAFSIGELRDGYNAHEMHDAGFSANDLSSAGYSWDELASAGFTLSDLESAGAGDSVLRNIFPADFPASDDDSASQYHSF